MLFDTCYYGVVSLANATLVSSELSVDAASQETWRDSVQGAIREAFTDSGYTIGGL